MDPQDEWIEKMELLAHIFCPQVLSIATYDSWPGMGDAGLRKAQWIGGGEVD